MCRAVHVRLSPSERKEVARWSGVMLPVYASIVAVILVALIASNRPRTGEMIAAAGNSAASDIGSGKR